MCVCVCVTLGGRGRLLLLIIDISPPATTHLHIYDFMKNTFSCLPLLAENKITPVLPPNEWGAKTNVAIKNISQRDEDWSLLWGLKRGGDERRSLISSVCRLISGSMPLRNDVKYLFNHPKGSTNQNTSNILSSPVHSSLCVQFIHSVAFVPNAIESLF